METFTSPFAFFVCYHFTFSVFAAMIYLITFFATHWKVYVEKW